MLTERIIKNVLTEILFESLLCESIQQSQLVDYFYREMLCEAILVGEPLDITQLRKLLHDKIVNFEFIKLNGEVRPAKGTTMMKHIPSSDHPKGIRPSSPKVATFWDMSKKAWRSVSVRSKEIVLKKETDDSAVVSVRDKKEKTPNEVIVKKVEEPKKEEPQKKVEAPKPVEKPIVKTPVPPAPQPVATPKPAEGPEIKTFAPEVKK